VYSAIIDTPIDVPRIVERVSSNANGATVIFVGTVREVNDGRDVTGIEYTAYRSMAERELASIVEEAAALAHSNDIAVSRSQLRIRIAVARSTPLDMSSRS
jgi:molybdopterin synthase catalytic subunit